MLKSELIQHLADNNPHLSMREAEQVVGTVFEAIVQSLENGQRVELRGFGSFSVKHRPARISRNPKTGKTVNVPTKHVPFFKMSKDIHELLNS